MAAQVEASTRIPAQSHLNSYVQTGSAGDNAKTLRDGQTPNWQKGEVIEGKILSAGEKNITLEVNGQVMEARLEGKFEFIEGEMVRLTVTDASLEKLLLKPMLDADMMSEKRLEDIVKQLGLKVSPENKELVRELMGAKLPLSADNLKLLQMMMIRHPQVNVRNMVLLMKNGIPLTDANINELAKTQNPEDMLANRLNEMIGKLVQTMQTENGENLLHQLAEGNPETEKILEYLKTMVSGKEQDASQGDTRLLSSFLNRNEIKALAQQIENLLKDFPNMVQKHADPANSGGTKEGPVFSGQTGNFFSPEENRLIQSVLTEMKQGILEGEIQSLQNILNKSQVLPKELRDQLRLLLSERLSMGALRKGIFLNGKEEDPIKHLERLFSKLGQVKSAADNSSMLVKDAMQDISSARDSMNFMAKFQNNAGFLQLPFFMGDKILNGELFVLKNRKNKKEDGKDEISALLQLDFATLGHLDTFIKKDGLKLQIDFYAEDKTKEKWLKEKMYLLHNRLLEKNYQILAINTFIKKKKTDGFADFLANEQVQKISRFSFDVRA
ncbi:hypothetical protein EII17_05625 [Clostridiales bacterium COT073_COT-073]|nr:hypothetical protein EII17_05625 [Clostridiales bacterium COT073_COT-073]